GGGRHASAIATPRRYWTVTATPCDAAMHTAPGECAQSSNAWPQNRAPTSRGSAGIGTGKVKSPCASVPGIIADAAVSTNSAQVAIDGPQKPPAPNGPRTTTEPGGHNPAT